MDRADSRRLLKSVQQMKPIERGEIAPGRVTVVSGKTRRAADPDK